MESQRRRLACRCGPNTTSSPSMRRLAVIWSCSLSYDRRPMADRAVAGVAAARDGRARPVARIIGGRDLRVRCRRRPSALGADYERLRRWPRFTTCRVRASPKPVGACPGRAVDHQRLTAGNHLFRRHSRHLHQAGASPGEVGIPRRKDHNDVGLRAVEKPIDAPHALVPDRVGSDKALRVQDVAAREEPDGADVVGRPHGRPATVCSATQCAVRTWRSLMFFTLRRRSTSSRTSRRPGGRARRRPAREGASAAARTVEGPRSRTHRQPG